MIYFAVFTGIFLLRLLLKLKFWTVVVAWGYVFIMLPVHFALYKKCRREEKRFEEVCMYLDILLDSFLREGKIIRAFEDVGRTLPDGKMKEIVIQAIERMEMVTDEKEIYQEAMEIVADTYDCRRMRNIHDFLLHVEYYGGEIVLPIKILLEDKNRWQARICKARKERTQMFREVVMSVVASFIICGSILYLPVMNVDISGNVFSQAAALMVIIFNELILWKGQSCMAVDWLVLEDYENEKNIEKKMMEYRSYDEKKGQRQSCIMAALPLFLFGWNLFKGKELQSAIYLVLVLIVVCQHRIGHAIAGKSLSRSIQCAFPKWLMDLILLLQSENVHMALINSREQAPLVLQAELDNLIARIEMDPESAEPYHNFLAEFAMPEIHAAMSMLFALSAGTSGNVQGQINELVARNLKMMDLADDERMKNRNGSMYLLFLAPVLVASMKLLVDMAVFLVTFLSMNMM